MCGAKVDPSENLLVMSGIVCFILLIYNTMLLLLLLCACVCACECVCTCMPRDVNEGGIYER